MPELPKEIIEGIMHAAINSKRNDKREEMHKPMNMAASAGKLRDFARTESYSFERGDIVQVKEAYQDSVKVYAPLMFYRYEADSDDLSRDCCCFYYDQDNELQATSAISFALEPYTGPMPEDV